MHAPLTPFQTNPMRILRLSQIGLAAGKLPRNSGGPNVLWSKAPTKANASQWARSEAVAAVPNTTVVSAEVKAPT